MTTCPFDLFRVCCYAVAIHADTRLLYRMFLDVIWNSSDRVVVRGPWRHLSELARNSLSPSSMNLDSSRNIYHQCVCVELDRNAMTPQWRRRRQRCTKTELQSLNPSQALMMTWHIHRLPIQHRINARRAAQCGWSSIWLYTHFRSRK